jgi:hypothetical protein
VVKLRCFFYVVKLRYFFLYHGKVGILTGLRFLSRTIHSESVAFFLYHGKVGILTGLRLLSRTIHSESVASWGFLLTCSIKSRDADAANCTRVDPNPKSNRDLSTSLSSSDP